MYLSAYRPRSAEDPSLVERTLLSLPLARFLAADPWPARTPSVRRATERDPAWVELGKGFVAERRAGRPLLARALLDLTCGEESHVVSDKLLRVRDDLYRIGLDGRVTRDPPFSTLAAFDVARVCDAAPDETVWPVPCPPVLVVRGDPDRDVVPPWRTPPELPRAAVALLRPGLCLPLVAASFDVKRLEGVPVVACGGLVGHLLARTRRGVFHPERSGRGPGRGSEAAAPLVLFSAPHRAWRDIAALLAVGP